MRMNKMVMMFVIASLLIPAFVGCSGPSGPLSLIIPADVQPQQHSSPTARRFEQSTPQGPTAVQSAIEMSEKYAALSQEMAVLTQTKTELDNENIRLKKQIDSTERQLRQTRKELTEANHLLVEMRVELNNWKNDVLGFRGEMRNAEKTQLEALLRILTLLSGEYEEQATQSAGTAPAGASSS